MSIDIIEGKWLGRFFYGEGYPFYFQTRPVSFMLELICDNGLLRGISTDEITKELFLKPATIEGTFKDKTVIFIKKYECLVAFDENQKLVAVRNQPSVEFEYKGKLRKKIFSKQYYLKGKWELLGFYMGGTGNLKKYTFKGTWAVEKME